MATKVVCFSRLLKCLRSLYGKQCGPRSDSILGNPGMIHSIPTAFMMNAVGMEWITPGLPRMMNAVGREWIMPDKCNG